MTAMLLPDPNPAIDRNIDIHCLDDKCCCIIFVDATLCKNSKKSPCLV